MFEKILQTQFPRLLTQACRDENAPFYGCFDRNWWHYRIRDFASIMLQQGGYTAYLCGKLDPFKQYASNLAGLAKASAIFWNQRACRRGAFEEYYPWEKGYPPLAFSTLAMAKLTAEGVVDKKDIAGGLSKAAKQLQQRFESQAGNQQVAGLAALAVIRKIEPGLVSEEKYLQQKQQTLELQHPEGWYTEYDGPDLGYLSVTMDCLWDLFDFTGDEDYLLSATRALEFLHGFVSRAQGGAGMHNARNTDYIVPYGITRFLDPVVLPSGETSPANEKDSSQKKAASTGEKYASAADRAASLLHLLYSGMDDPQHFFHAIDDRYWSHYIGHSVVRAQLLLDGNGPTAKTAPKTSQAAAQTNSQTAATSPNTTATSTPEPFNYTGAGYLFLPLGKVETQLVVAGKKGGIFSVVKAGKTVYSDFGWIAFSGKKQYVSHWWAPEWKISHDSDPGEATSRTEGTTPINISGHLYPHREKFSKPLLHMGLRVISFLTGSVLTRLLRNVLIFKSKPSAISFDRKIEVSEKEVVVTDRIGRLDRKVRVERAPRASKRHVASADSWHREDWIRNEGVEVNESIESGKNEVVITTRILL